MPGLKPRPPKEKAKDKSPKKVLKISAQKTNAQRKGFKKAPKASAQRERLKEDASRKRLMQALGLKYLRKRSKGALAGQGARWL
jgi:hypothetical protein